MPSFVTSVFFFIFAIQSFTVGLILQTIAKRNKQDFEFKLNQYTDKFEELKKDKNNE